MKYLNLFIFTLVATTFAHAEAQKVSARPIVKAVIVKVSTTGNVLRATSEKEAYNALVSLCTEQKLNLSEYFYFVNDTNVSLGICE